VNGDIVQVSGVVGDDAGLWNGIFGIYGVSDFSFRYYMKKPPAPVPSGNPVCSQLRCLFDEVMQGMAKNVRIHIGPGLFHTRGFAPNDSRGWQLKTGQKIIGAGMEVTTLRLIGAENADQHYHVVGMPIEPTGTSPIAPLENFEISHLTLDCNADAAANETPDGLNQAAVGSNQNRAVPPQRVSGFAPANEPEGRVSLSSARRVRERRKRMNFAHTVPDAPPQRVQCSFAVLRHADGKWARRCTASAHPFKLRAHQPLNRGAHNKICGTPAARFVTHRYLERHRPHLPGGFLSWNRWRFGR
jgi:hypothetical protein